MVWKDTGRVGLQMDKQQWDIDLRIISDAEVLISYPSLGCSGHWELVQNGKRKGIVRK